MGGSLNRYVSNFFMMNITFLNVTNNTAYYSLMLILNDSSAFIPDWLTYFYGYYEETTLGINGTFLANYPNIIGVPLSHDVSQIRLTFRVDDFVWVADPIILIPTNLTVYALTENELRPGENVTLLALLTDNNGVGLANRNVSFWEYDDDGVLQFIGRVLTDAGGVALLPEHLVRYKSFTVFAEFDGYDLYMASSGEATCELFKLNTILIIHQPQDTAFGKNITITGTFRTTTGSPLGGFIFSLSLNGDEYEVIVNSDGTWSFNYPVGIIGPINVYGYFFETIVYEYSSDEKLFYGIRLSSYLQIEDVPNVFLNDTAYINGTLIDENGNPVKNAMINVTITGVNVNLNVTTTTDEYGNWNISYNRTNTTGLYHVVVVFSGNDIVFSVSNTTVFQVIPLSTQLTINPIDDVPGGSNVNITGTLIGRGGVPVVNRTIFIIITHGETQNTYNTTTDEYGNWSYELIGVEDGYTINVLATFNGDTTAPITFSCSSNSTFFNADIMYITTLVIDDIDNVEVGSWVTITGTLYYDDGGTIPLHSTNLTVRVEGIPYNVTTNDNGFWSLPYFVNTTSSINVIAIFNGTAIFSVATAAATFNGDVIKSILIIDNIDPTKLGRNITIRGMLLGVDGNPVHNAKITIEINRNQNITITTNNGFWIIENIPVGMTGINNVIAYFDGEIIDGVDNYGAVSNSTSFIGLSLNSTIVVNDIAPTLINRFANITGYLEDENGDRIAHVPVNVRIGLITYNTTTDEYGNWYVDDVLVTRVGTISATPMFRGNTNHTPSSKRVTFMGLPLESHVNINPIPNIRVGENVTITGSLTDIDDNPIPNANLTIIIHDSKLIRTSEIIFTNSQGLWSFNYSTNNGGHVSVRVVYDGNDTYHSGTGEDHYHVFEYNTYITIDDIGNTKLYINTTISGYLFRENGDSFVGLVGQEVIIIVDGKNYTTSTGIGGLWSISHNVTSVGDISVIAIFDAIDVYNNATNSSNFQGLQLNTTIIIHNIPNTKVNNTVNINGYLRDEFGRGVGYTKFNVTIDGENHIVTTDSYGYWEIPNYKVLKIGLIEVNVTFEGNSFYNESKNLTTFNGSKRDSILIINPIDDDILIDSDVVITGILIGDNGPLGVVTFNLTINGYIFTVTTDEYGNWTHTYPANTSGEIIVLAEFWENGFYNSISDSISFHVSEMTTVNLTIVKSVNVTTATEGSILNGEVIEYNITVTNHDTTTTTTANNVKVYEKLLEGSLIYIHHYINDEEDYDNNYNPIDGIWNIGNLAPGDIITLRIVVRVNGTGNITNHVNVTASEENIGVNETNVTITVDPVINLTITKSVNSSSALNGENLTYIINVTNHGPDNATNVNVTEILNTSKVEILDYEISDNGGTWHDTYWYIGNLTHGNSATLTIIVRIISAGNITNEVNVTADQYNEGNNSANVTTEVYSTVNLTISKSVNVTGRANLNDVVVYTINVTNHGPDNASNVTVRDILDT
ncbi:MAG: hypothetical protein FWE58_04315, partial [Methanobrevibacter sp.]|nr:hypothetical protein [Methanobrevibacter sp.]